MDAKGVKNKARKAVEDQFYCGRGKYHFWRRRNIIFLGVPLQELEL